MEPEFLELGREIVMRMWKKKEAEIERGTYAGQAEIEGIERQINELINIIPVTKSDTVRARYEAKVEELDQRALEIKNSMVNKKEPNFEEALTLTLKLLGTPAETWENVGQELKTMIHNMIFMENPKYALKTGFGTPSLSLPFSIKDHIVGQKGELVEVAGVAPASSADVFALLHAQMRGVRPGASASRRTGRCIAKLERGYDTLPRCTSSICEPEPPDDEKRQARDRS